jgi:hypothetical protein
MNRQACTLLGLAEAATAGSRHAFAPVDSTERRCADCAALGTRPTRTRAWLHHRSRA